MQKRHLAILGSTGSIGTQTLEVVEANPDIFEVEVLTAQNNADLLIEQAAKFRPNVVVISNEDLYDKVFAALDPLDIKVYTGEKSLVSVVEMESVNMVLTALVGYAGLIPTVSAIKAGKHIALANKETLVVAGELVTELAQKHKVDILPVDSEHSAIFQCLVGEFHNPIEKIILTASGGPFRGKDREFLKTVTKAQALKHPNWSMGAKITIDSASLMNKGLEVIEAKWLFGLTPDQIEVVVHPQSIIHSMVQFEDGSMKAQMGLPDMRVPIQFAIGYPNRLKSNFPRMDFAQFPSLTFEKPDYETFRNLGFAFEALEVGGNMACIINAANEIAVEAFLDEHISWSKIAGVIERTMQHHDGVLPTTVEDILQADASARRFAALELTK